MNRSDRNRGEQGSALLIVFLMAAVIAVALYAELPAARFEARRDQEQLLMDRGHEYVGAVRLFVRRFGTYPPSLEALENTNNIRFLRRRFKDPLTGSDVWRLLHSGGGALLADSKLKPQQVGQDDFSESAQRSERQPRDAVAAAPATEVTAIPRRGAAVPAHDATTPIYRNEPRDEPQDEPPVSTAAAIIARQAEPSDSPPLAAQSQDAPLLSGGAVGGIAGVASLAGGRTIKVYQGQTDFSLWEFFYDPRTDPLRMAQLMQQNMVRDALSGHDPNNNGAPGMAQDAVKGPAPAIPLK